MQFQPNSPFLYSLGHDFENHPRADLDSLCSFPAFGKTGIVYHWKGKTKNSPRVLMSHYDVVPAEEESWEKSAFEGILEANILWGGGTLDTAVKAATLPPLHPYHRRSGLIQGHNERIPVATLI